MVKEMKIKELYWVKRLFRKNDSERWKIKIIIYASEDEIQELRNLESKSILKKIFDL